MWINDERVSPAVDSTRLVLLHEHHISSTQVAQQSNRITRLCAEQMPQNLGQSLGLWESNAFPPSPREIKYMYENQCVGGFGGTAAAEKLSRNIDLSFHCTLWNRPPHTKFPLILPSLVSSLCEFSCFGTLFRDAIPPLLSLLDQLLGAIENTVGVLLACRTSCPPASLVVFEKAIFAKNMIAQRFDRVLKGLLAQRAFLWYCIEIFLEVFRGTILCLLLFLHTLLPGTILFVSLHVVLSNVSINTIVSK
mmetsp:Transcript_10186/g.37878  ORF Transcript_10186/g.37878 Transcript_10186/m.37878 type:complete len:250 (+) Transcript_10186:1853-2602(+)